MKVKVKLFAMLDRYLPQGATDNQTVIEVAEGTTPAAVIRTLNLPADCCQLVLVNGTHLAADEREARALKANDELAVWPPIAGG